EDGGRRDAQRLHAAEAGDADDGEVVRAAAGRDLDLVAEAVALVLGGRRVDDDLAVAGRPAAGVEPERGDALGARDLRVEADAEVRAVAGRLAVALDDLRLVRDVGDRDLHAGDVADLVHQAGVHRRAL